MAADRVRRLGVLFTFPILTPLQAAKSALAAFPLILAAW